MILTFYTNTSASNTIGKDLVIGDAMNIVLKRDFNVLEPIIYLIGADITPYNYFHLGGVINRFYFIDSVRVNRGNVLEIHASCDYLETYKVDILASYAKHRAVIEGGMFGDVEVNLTGDYSEVIYSSDVELVEADNSVLSVLGY